MQKINIIFIIMLFSLYAIANNQQKITHTNQIKTLITKEIDKTQQAINAIKILKEKQREKN